MIITTVLQMLLERIALGSPLPAAIAAPRASQRNTAQTIAEPDFIASSEAEALGACDHLFTSTPEIGAATGIEFLDGHRVLGRSGTCSPRRCQRPGRATES